MGKGVNGNVIISSAEGNLAAASGYKSQAIWLKQLHSLNYETPFKVIDFGEARNNVRRLQKLLSGVEIYYAVKSNSDKGLISSIKDLVEGFDVASVGEFKTLRSAGISARRVLFSNPVKVPSHIEASFRAGVSYYAFDSLDEIKKLAKYAPGAMVYARVKVSDAYSKFPLSRKFGIEPANVLGYMSAAMLTGLRPIGLTFHVGSQAEDPQAWARALRTCGRLIANLSQYGISIEIVNIGGGIPASYSNRPLSISGITRTINSSIKQFIPPGVRIMAELGRSISASSSVIVARVIARETRADNREWLFLDMGVFQGLIEPLEIPGWRYPVFSDHRNRVAALKDFVLTGPTCDAYDTIGFDYSLPASMAVGDRLYFGSAGAYTSVYGSNFNGFAPPTIHYLESDSG